jgi:Zn-dependent protease
MEKIPEFVIWYAVFLFTLTFHEGAHALLAYWGGDDTAYRGGQVTLNPIPHIRREPFGTILIPILTFFMSGWMMGWASAPYDRYWGQRHPKRLAAMSAAGPAANLLLATAAFIVLKLLLGAGYFVSPGLFSFSHVVEPAAAGEGSLGAGLALLLSVALNLNILLCLFNLIPLPPLDGAGVVQGLFPGTVGRALESVATNPMFSMMGLLIAWRVFGYVFSPVFWFVMRLLYAGTANG